MEKQGMKGNGCVQKDRVVRTLSLERGRVTAIINMQE